MTKKKKSKIKMLPEGYKEEHLNKTPEGEAKNLKLIHQSMGRVRPSRKVEKYIYTGEGEDKVAELNPAWAKSLNRQASKIRLKQSDIPRDYWDIEFSHYQGERSIESYKKVVQYADNCESERFHNVNLYLHGMNNSSQKTMMACNAGKAFINEGLSVKFILAGDLIDILMKSQGFNYIPEVENAKNELCSVDLLIIDDAFDRNKTLTWDSRAKNLIVLEWDKFLRRLISNDIRIIITSNFGMHSVELNYSKSIYELLDRNFIQLEFQDCIKEVRKSRFDNLFT